jgi:hypothetical protein
MWKARKTERQWNWRQLAPEAIRYLGVVGIKVRPTPSGAAAQVGLKRHMIERFTWPYGHLSSGAPIGPRRTPVQSVRNVAI